MRMLKRIFVIIISVILISDFVIPFNFALAYDNIFSDIDQNSSTAKSIYWAAENGYIKGYKDGTFKAKDDCTREQFVIILWRMAGKPEPQSIKNPFSDINSSSSSYKAIIWATEHNIIKGYNDGTFRPKEPVTRAQVVIMLWRQAGKPEISGKEFSDVPSFSSVYKPVIWGSGSGIVKGFNDGTFRPSENCTREQIVTFLYRYNEKILQNESEKEKTNQHTITPEDYYRYYTDETCQIGIKKEWYCDTWCYCAHVQLSDYSRFGSASANGWYGNGTESTFHAGQRLGAILCVNGDYACQAAEPHAAIRRGVVEAYGEKATYVPEAYNAYTGMLFNAFEGYCFPDTDTRCSSYTIKEAANADLITDTFIFGPAGLNDGVVSGSNVGNKRPRTLIGTTGIPGDLWLVVTAGDYSDGVSTGLTGYEGIKLLYDLGCTFGGHLDGGGSSAMYFNGEMLVANEGWEGRYVADFAYVR